MFDINLINVYFCYLEQKLITSIFFTFQSPIFLLSVLEKIEHTSKHNNFELKRVVKVGDRVTFIDEKIGKQYQVILVSNKRRNPSDGLISIYSYLGASIFSLSENDCFNLYILGEVRSYRIKNISYEKTILSKPENRL